MSRQRSISELKKYIESCVVFKSEDYFDFFEFVLILNPEHIESCRISSVSQKTCRKPETGNPREYDE